MASSNYRDKYNPQSYVKKLKIFFRNFMALSKFREEKYLHSSPFLIPEIENVSEKFQINAGRSQEEVRCKRKSY